MIIEQTISGAIDRLESIRDAVAAVYARSAAGDAQAIQQAADQLSSTVDTAQPDCARLQRLLAHLGNRNMPEAAQVLCNGGRTEAAHALMRIHSLAAGTASALHDVSSFIEECLNSLGATQAATQRQARGGRLLGSA